MSVKIVGTEARVHWLSNQSPDGKLTKDQAVLYEVGKFGQVTRDSAEGLTPAEAFERRYTDKSPLKEDLIARELYVIDKTKGSNFDYDDGFRAFCHDLYKKGRIPFYALHPGYQLPNTNNEALVSYDQEAHSGVLLNCLKQYLGLGVSFDTKDSISWRYKQEEDIEDVFERLSQYRLCLYAAYTSRGKTKISIEVAVRVCQQGGLVLVTTPITDTKQSFKENIDNYHFGADRNLRVVYMDSTEFSKHDVATLRQRANNGELIFIVLTVQDLRYGDAVNTDLVVEQIRDKYSALSGEVNLWIRDERHAQYGGEITSQRLADMCAEYELDLTATPYNVLDKYNWNQIVTRTLLWGLKHQQHTKLPTIRIDAISTPIANINPKIAAVYTEEEGFDARKLFVRSNSNFVLRAELLNIRDKMYHITTSKKKNPLSIVNDEELSDIATTCGIWVLPEGQDGDGAAEYIPELAVVLNVNSATYFTDSYTIEKECPTNTSIGDYVEMLIAKHGRVVILTCGKFLTGTDIPALGHIVLFAKMNNVANFEQLLGRMIREYPGKKEVKMYCVAPAMEVGGVGFLQGLAAKLSSELGGGTEYEMLECVPLTEYTITGPKTISPDAILEPVYAFLKSNSRDKIPQAALEDRLAEVDLSVWQDVNVKNFKTTIPKTQLTDENGAKVKNKLSTNPQTGEPRTKAELVTLAYIANAIQAVMVEAKWVAYSLDVYDYSVVLRSQLLAVMFPTELDAIIETIDADNVIREMVIKNLNDKQLAYKGLPLLDVCDDLFVNTEYKKKLGLVYISAELADKLIANISKHIYSKDGAGMSFLVINALNGILAVKLKQRFPKARIVCAEYFEYFKDHLTRLGFEVVSIDVTDSDVRIGTNVKFDVIIGNPPYQDAANTGEQQKTLLPHCGVKS